MLRLFLIPFIVALSLTCTIADYNIRNASDLIDIFENTIGSVYIGDLSLSNDLDFSDTNIELPLGYRADGSCVAFAGELKGNGHSIKGLKMNGTNRKDYQNAGLFCNLRNVRVNDLVIDSSCSFTGNSAGALSASVSGSLEVSNVINKASVSGKSYVGGLIGTVEDLNSKGVLFINTVNDGKITVQQNYGGGFIGMVFNNTSTSVTFSNCSNNGLVSGSFITGGLIGDIATNNDISVTLSNCTNNGIITGSSSSVGGLLGHLSNNNQADVAISNCTNNGTVIGKSNVGGLIGYIWPSNSIKSTSLLINNCANRGNVSAQEEMACGMFCINKQYENNIASTVLNSINKGNVTTQSNGYGITNIITKGRNVVSLGDVTCENSPYTFWNVSTDVDLFYGLEVICRNCGHAIFIEYDKNTGSYDVIGKGEHVHDILNDEAVNQNFGMLWTSKLELVHELFSVKVSGSLNRVFFVELGRELERIGNLSYFFQDEDHGVVSGNRETRIVYNEKDIVSQNMNVIVGKWVNVSIGSPINRTQKMVVGETLEQVSELFSFSLEDYTVLNQNTMAIINKNWAVETDTTLALCHTVIVSGQLNDSWYIEHGTILGNVKMLKSFWSNEYTFFDNLITKNVIMNTTPVTRNITLVIVKSTRVVIEITPVNEVNTADIIRTVSEIVGNGETIISVDIVQDGNGEITGITIVVKGEQAGNTLVDAINAIDTGNGCTAGVLCRRKRAYMEGEALSLSGCSTFFISTLAVALILFLFVF